MTKNEKFAIFISLTIGVVGLIIGLYTVGDNFARSGALIVIVGIVHGLFKLPNLLKMVDLFVQSEGEKIRKSAIDDLIDNGVSNEDADKISQEALDQVADALNKEAKKRKRKHAFIEAMILICGTLIWGFGDLVNPACFTTC